MARLVTPEEVRVFKINELIESVEILLRYNAYLTMLLGQSQARYRELEEEYNRLLHSDNRLLLEMYRDGYNHLMLILESSDEDC